MIAIKGQKEHKEERERMKTEYIYDETGQLAHIEVVGVQTRAGNRKFVTGLKPIFKSVPGLVVLCKIIDHLGEIIWEGNMVLKRGENLIETNEGTVVIMQP